MKRTSCSLAVDGPDLGHDSLIIEANAGIKITPQIAATIGYDGQVARDNYGLHCGIRRGVPPKTRMPNRAAFLVSFLKLQNFLKDRELFRVIANKDTSRMRGARLT
jgi:hypothetical protein